MKLCLMILEQDYKIQASTLHYLCMIDFIFYYNSTDICN